MEKGNFEEFGEEGGCEHVADKGESKTGFLLGCGEPGEEAAGAFMGNVKNEEHDHKSLDQEPGKQVLFGGEEAFGDRVTEGH